MTINNRAAIVGQYPTEGAGGSVEPFMMPENISAQMTFGRAVDAQGNIHLEGKGVVPTVKVPVTLDTLKQESNGQDVVLDAAVAHLGGSTSSSDSNAALPAATAAPKLTVDSSAEAALTSGTKFIEDLAKEKYQASDFNKPGTLTYTVNLNTTQDLIWAYGWCAKTSDLLQQNLQSIKVTFNLDGKDMKASDMASFDNTSGGQQCKFIYALLTDWPAGQHHLITTATFTQKINDGSADYAAGDYVLDYTVNIKQ
jgi:hypothetical protein